MLGKLRGSGLVQRCGLYLDSFGPSRRPYLWIFFAGICGYLLSCHLHSCLPLQSLGVLFIRHPPLLIGPQVSENSSLQDIELRYYSEQSTNHVFCSPQRRVGNSGDGGWDLCLAERFRPRPPCLIYSFGVEFVWNYDEALARDFGCVVRAFDPSMDMKQHVHRPGPVYFYPYGLAGSNTVWPDMFVRHREDFKRKITAEWKMRTLDSLLTMNQDQTKIIDILKIDIEYSEWEVFEQMLSTGTLKTVKMLLFETHTNEINQRSTSKKDYLRYLSIIRRIEALGFRKYKSHFNRLGISHVRDNRWRSGRLRWYQLPTFAETCCYEQFYINVQFLF